MPNDDKRRRLFAVGCAQSVIAFKRFIFVDVDDDERSISVGAREFFIDGVRRSRAYSAPVRFQ